MKKPRNPLSYIRFPSDISKQHVQHVGGKAANLGELYKLGFDVPQGFSITTEAFEEFLKYNELESQREKIAECFLSSRGEEARKEAKELASRTREGHFPTRLHQELQNALDKLGRPERAYFAVRSSATVEDELKTSFAGQFKTILGVRRSGLSEAIKDCWASLFESGVLSYAEKHDLLRDYGTWSMGIIVQQLINADASGVCFTVDPVSADPKLIRVEATWGLGQPLVSGRVTPDTYLVQKSNLRVAHKKLGSKKLRQDISANGIRDRRTSLKEGSSYCLQESLAVSICQASLRIEEYFLAPQDIEWAVSDGHPFILQTRPITTLSTK